MICIEIKAEDLKSKKVYQALLQLLSALHTCHAESLYVKVQETNHTKLVSPSNKSHSKENPPIDPIIKDEYGHIISKNKSLYFLSLIKNFTSINSDQIAREMKVYYPLFSRKSIGGITGALKRWFENEQLSIPYLSVPDPHYSGIHIFTWMTKSSPQINIQQQNALMNQVPKKYQSYLLSLLMQGTIKKNSMGHSTFHNFIKILNKLPSQYFSWNEQEIICKY